MRKHFFSAILISWTLTKGLIQPIWCYLEPIDRSFPKIRSEGNEKRSRTYCTSILIAKTVWRPNAFLKTGFFCFKVRQKMLPYFCTVGLFAVAKYERMLGEWISVKSLKTQVKPILSSRFLSKFSLKMTIFITPQMSSVWFQSIQTVICYFQYMPLNCALIWFLPI